MAKGYTPKAALLGLLEPLTQFFDLLPETLILLRIVEVEKVRNTVLVLYVDGGHLAHRSRALTVVAKFKVSGHIPPFG
jgi:hypothetical protein